MKDYFKISFRSLLFRKKQYLSLFLVCAFGVAISLFCLFLQKGMKNALESKAKIYYGGDYQFIGQTGWLGIADSKSIMKQLAQIFPEGSVITDRFDFDADYAALYFEGTGVRQRVIKGIHFDTEQKLLSNFNYVEGSEKDFLCEEKNIIMLSEPIAKMLNVHKDDEITFMLRNNNGQLDTATLIVKGIFKDSSLFGMYTSYMDMELLQQLFFQSTYWCNRICIMLPDGSPTERDTKYYQSELEKQFTMYPIVENKQIFYDLLWSLPMPTYALIKLSANLQDVKILIEAMTIIIAFIITVLVIIIITGVSSTYRVIVIKRINEIGIYKSIGMKRRKISWMLLLETAFLIFLGSITGILFSFVLCKFINLFNFSFIPAFDIFLVGGALKPGIRLWYIFAVCSIVFVTTLIAVWFSIKKTVSVTPCEALSTIE